jgi:adiponectin receptor
MESDGSTHERRAPRTDGTLKDMPHYIRRSNPHLHSGHRVHHSTLRQCVASLFTIHNESVNVWSHLIPVFLFVHLTYSVWHDPRKHDGSHVVFAAYLASCCLLCSFSSVYHLFSCHSERVHDVVVRLDFIGIIFVIASSFAMALFYGFHCYPVYRNLYLIVTLVLDFSLLALSFARIEPYKRRLIFVAAVVFAVVPLSHLAVLFGLNHAVLRHVFVLLLLYGAAFAFYALRFPEKYFPNRFDLFGASHQIWHLLLDIAFLYFYLAMETVHYGLSYQNCALLPK